jgi:hypothetical protein
MRSIFRSALAIGTLAALAACGGDGPTEPERGAPCVVANATATINIGQTVTGSLGTSDCFFPDSSFADVYRLTVPTGQTLRIDMTSTAVDAYLLVFSQAGTPIDDDDDGANDGSTNARLIRTFAAGTYFVAANSFDKGEVGAYTLSVVTTTESPTCALTSATSTLEIGQTTGGTLSTSDCALNDGSYADVYRFVVPTNQTLQLDMSSTAFDTYIGLVDANGNLIAEDDDGAGGSNSRLTRALGAGTYYFVATSFDPGMTGTYQVSLTTSTAPAPATCDLSAATNFTLGQTLNATLANTDCRFNDGTYFDLYRVTLTAGQSLEVTMSSSVFDTYLLLFDAAGAPLEENDDLSDTSTNSRIFRTVTAGTYYIAANGYAPTDLGAYSITIR